MENDVFPAIFSRNKPRIKSSPIINAIDNRKAVPVEIMFAKAKMNGMTTINVINPGDKTSTIAKNKDSL